MRAARFCGVVVVLSAAAPAIAGELPGGWLTATSVPRVQGVAPHPDLIGAPVSVGQLDCGSFPPNANVCITGFSIVNTNVPNGGGIFTEMPWTAAAERHLVGPGANCSPIAHRAAVEVDSSRNRDVQVDFGYRDGVQRRMYTGQPGCAGDDLDLKFRDSSGPPNVCNPAPGATISPVQSLSALNGGLLAGKSYTMTVRDTAAGSTTRFLLAGHETYLTCPGATFPLACPGVSASVAGTAAFTESALAGAPQPHFSASGLTACIMSGQFAVGLEFEFSATDKGEGTMVPLTDLITAVYFKNPANLEALIKVINGCPINGNFWVFIGGLTDQRVIITVTHMPTGFTRYYINRSGQAFLPVQDTEAFPLCTNGI
jgi:hypothetical protein